MAETLVHAVPLPHLDLEKIVDQICGCERNMGTVSISCCTSSKEREVTHKRFTKQKMKFSRTNVVDLHRHLHHLFHLVIPFTLYVGGAAVWAVGGDLKVIHFDGRQRKARAKFKQPRRVGGEDSSDV